MSSQRYYHAGDVLMACLMIAVVAFTVLALVAVLVAGDTRREIFSWAAYIFLGVVCLSPVVSLLFGRAEGIDPPLKWFKKRRRQR